MNLLPKYSKSVSVFANTDAKSVARLLLGAVWDASSSSHRRGARCRAIDRCSLEPLETRSMMAAGDPTMPIMPAIPMLIVVESQGTVSLLKDSTGLAYVQEVGKQPIVVSRADSYWNGNVPLTRSGARLRQFKAWFGHRAWTSPAARIRWQGACGHYEGRIHP